MRDEPLNLVHEDRRLAVGGERGGMDCEKHFAKLRRPDLIVNRCERLVDGGADRRRVDRLVDPERRTCRLQRGGELQKSTTAAKPRLAVGAFNVDARGSRLLGKAIGKRRGRRDRPTREIDFERPPGIVVADAVEDRPRHARLPHAARREQQRVLALLDDLTVERVDGGAPPDLTTFRPDRLLNGEGPYRSHGDKISRLKHIRYGW